MAAPSKNKCLICSEELLQQYIKVHQSSQHDTKISGWKLLSLESLCMLFGLPVNHLLITTFSKGNGTSSRGRILLCNRCLEDLSDIHFVFWQLHNLELRLIKMQKIMYQRLLSRLNQNRASAETAYDGDTHHFDKLAETEENEGEEIFKKLFNDIKSGSVNSWPKGVYISRWKEALENVDRTLSHNAPNEVELTGNVKVEVDHELDDAELFLLQSQENEEDTYHEFIEEHLWNDQDHKDQLEIPNTRRKSKRQVKSKNSKNFDDESPPDSPDNREDILEEDEDYFLLEDLDNPLDAEIEDDDHPSSDSDYSEDLQTRKKPRRKRKTCQGGKPRKINNYQMTPEGKYLCTEDPAICSRTYDVKKRLTLHIIGFHKERNYICTEEGCVQKFLSQFKLNCHLKNDHDIKLLDTQLKLQRISGDKTSFLCTADPDICSRTYDTNKLLTKHIKGFHKGRNHICTEEGCTQKFLSELKLSYHLKKRHGIQLDTEVKPQRLIIDPNELPDKPVFKCTVDPSICNRIYPQLKFLNGHIKRFHKGRNFICDEEGCVQKFLTQVKLSQHLKLDHGIGRQKKPEETPKIKDDPEALVVQTEGSSRDCDAPHVCDICGLIVPRKLMKSHLTSKHLGFGRFKCDLCGMDFKNGEAIKTHEDLHNSYANTFPFTCVALDCGKVLTNSGDLRIHVNKNHLSSGLKCEICGVMKPNIVVLDKHVLIHSKERNLICDECGKAYFSARMLRLHKESSHLGKKVSCEICSKEFLRMSSLKRHRLSNHQEGERRYKCAICPKAFFNTTQRKNHEHTHAGVKNYECKECGKRFKQKNNLNQHLGTKGHKDKVGGKKEREEGDDDGGGRFRM